MRESLFQSKVIDAYTKHGWVVFNISDRFTSGIPDIYCAKDGKSVWREAKVFRRGHLTMGFSKAQKIKVFQLKRAGIDASGLVWVPELKTAFFVPPEDFEREVPAEERSLFPQRYPAFDFNNPQ